MRHVLRIRASRGFTLVELSTVLVLAGVLSAVALARLVPASAFAGADAQRTLLAAAHIAQQAALARTDGTVALTVIHSATQPTAAVAVTHDAGNGTAQLHRSEIAVDGLTLTIRSGGTSTQLNDGDALRLQFAGNGELATALLNGSAIAVSSGVGLRLHDAQQLDLCVATTGFAYAGICE